MPKRNLPPNRWYVYILYRLDGRPFYVGKGEGTRWLMHEYKVQRRRSHKDNIVWGILQSGSRVPKRKVFENLTNAEAVRLEIELIAKIGRKPAGPLVNLTAGGEGASDPSPEVRAKMSAAAMGRIISPETRALIRHAASNPSAETRAKMSAAALGKIVTAETRAKQSAVKRGVKKSEVTKARMRAAAALRPRARYERAADARRGRTLSAETKAKIAATLTGKKASVETRAKMSLGHIGRPIHTPESRAAIAAGHRGKKLSEDTKTKLRAANLGKTHTEETRAIIAENSRRSNASRIGVPRTPEVRARISAATKAAIAKKKSGA